MESGNTVKCVLKEHNDEGSMFSLPKDYLLKGPLLG